MSFISAAQNKLMESETGVPFHNMPQDRTPSNLHQGFGPELGFLSDSGSLSSGQNYHFHLFTTPSTERFPAAIVIPGTICP